MSYVVEAFVPYKGNERIYKCRKKVIDGIDPHDPEAGSVRRVAEIKLESCSTLVEGRYQSPENNRNTWGLRPADPGIEECTIDVSSGRQETRLTWPKFEELTSAVSAGDLNSIVLPLKGLRDLKIIQVYDDMDIPAPNGWSADDAERARSQYLHYTAEKMGIESTPEFQAYVDLLNGKFKEWGHGGLGIRIGENASEANAVAKGINVTDSETGKLHVLRVTNAYTWDGGRSESYYAHTVVPVVKTPTISAKLYHAVKKHQIGRAETPTAPPRKGEHVLA